MTRLERLIRNVLAATYRDRELGDVDLDQAARLAADVATIHLEHLNQPSIIPTANGYELRYRVVIPYDAFETAMTSARRSNRESRRARTEPT